MENKVDHLCDQINFLEEVKTGMWRRIKLFLIRNYICEHLERILFHDDVASQHGNFDLQLAGVFVYFERITFRVLVDVQKRAVFKMDGVQNRTWNRKKKDGFTS